MTDFTPDQHNAITTPGHLVVTAGAGSGKTRVLVERYLRLVDAVAARLTPGDDPFAAVLAVTFSEKAAREMRDRVRRAVAARASHAPDDNAFAAAAESARIGTIHSFCAELLRAHPAESGLDPRFAILDEVEAGALIAESVEATLRSAVASGAGLAPLLEAFTPLELAETLATMLQTGGELRAALAALPVDPTALLARWRDDLAAAQAAARIELLNEPAWQKAAATLLALAPAAPAGDRIGDQVIAIAGWLQTLDQTMPDFTALDAVNLTGGARKAWGGEEALRAAKAALRTLRAAYRDAAELLTYTPDPTVEARAAAASLAMRDLARAADAGYTRRKRDLDRLDFDDLERLARELLENHPQVRARWRRELHAVLVDEFQDTNDDQRAIIYALTGMGPPAEQDGPPGAGPGRPTTDGHAPALFVVGDGKQSIYRFRGADVSVFRQVEQELVSSGGTRITMRTSFRSHETLVALINRLGASLFARPGPPARFEVPFEPLEARRPSPPHAQAAELHIVADGDGAAAGREREAALLAERIAALVRGDAGPLVFDHGAGTWRVPTCGDIAVLFRASSSFEPFEMALRECGLPFLTTAGRGYYGRKEVQDLIHLLHALDDPTDELALVGALRSPLFALDDATIVSLRLTGGGLWDGLIRAAAGEGQGEEGQVGFDAVFADRREAIQLAASTLGELQGLRGRASVTELLRRALDRTGYPATISALVDGERRRANVEKLLAAARLAGTRGLRAFSDYLDRLLRAEVREGEAPLEADGAVRLMTIHRSKGLEFPVVALPDLGRGVPSGYRRWLAGRDYGLAVTVGRPADELPLPTAILLARRAEARMEQAESERLLYVGLTRAQDYLILSGPAQRKGGERWIARLAEALGHPWEDGGPPDGSLGALHVFRHDLSGAP